jgi:hypothetical protein
VCLQRGDDHPDIRRTKSRVQSRAHFGDKVDCKSIAGSRGVSWGSTAIRCYPEDKTQPVASRRMIAKVRTDKSRHERPTGEEAKRAKRCIHDNVRRLRVHIFTVLCVASVSTIKDDE